MKLKNLAFFGVMASILSVASAQAAEGDEYIASKGYVDRQVGTVSSGVTTALENYSTTEQMNSAISTAVSSKANSADVYSKTDADGKFADKTATQTALDAKLDTTTAASTYATQTALTDGLALKADKSTTYTKTEVDTALGDKANSADVYSKTAADAAFDANGAATAAETAAKGYTDTKLADYTKTENLATVATSGKSSDLTNDAGFITSADVPTKTSDLTNDSGFITKDVADLTNYTTTTAMNTELAKKVNTADVATSVTQNGANPVTGGAVYTAVQDAITSAQTIAAATKSAAENQVVTGVTTENGSVKSVTSTLIADANVSGTANIAPAKLNLSQSACPETKKCLLTYDQGGNYKATPIQE